MFCLILVAAFLFIYIKFIQPYQKWKKDGIISDKPWPILGNMAHFVFAKLSLSEIIKNGYEKFANKRYYGFFMFLTPLLVIRDVELIKQTAIKEFDSFVDRRKFVSEKEDPLFGKSLFSLTGQKWRDMRSLLSPAFSSSKMRLMFSLMATSADQFVQYLQCKLETEKTITLEMKDTFGRLATDVIASCAFGVQCDSLKEPNNDFFLKGKECADFDGLRSLKLFGYTISPDFMRFFRVKIFSNAVGDFFYNLVETSMKIRKEKNIVRPDMIHLLMQAREGKLKHDSLLKMKDAGYATLDENITDNKIMKSKPTWSQSDMTSQALLFFFAGFETTSTLLCHMANELILNPHIQKCMQIEIDEVIKEHGNNVSYEILLKMKYLDMVVSEALRKWPPVPLIDRTCQKDFVIKSVSEGEKEYVIKKGDVIVYPIYGIHMDPNFYPNPEKFDPERFNDENKPNIKQFTYLPFGIGPRGCIGSRFALLEAKTVYFYLLSKFNLVVVNETQIPLVIKRLQFNLHAEKGFFVGLQLRKTNF